MKFNEALDALNSGRPVRRAGSLFKWIRKVDPRIEPGIDGDSRVFVIMTGDKRYLSNQGEFSTEKEAAAALKLLRSNLTKEYTKYNKAQAAYDAATPEELEKGEVKPGISPTFRSNYYENAYTLERNASRSQRINVPYLIGLTNDGRTEVVTLSGSDLFAPDWSIA